MSQINALELAKQGNPQAIAALINKSLQPKGMQVKTTRVGERLLVAVEFETLTNRSALINFLWTGIRGLNIQGVNKLIVEGKKQGNSAFEWREVVDLTISEPPNSSQAIAASPKSIPEITSLQPISIRTNYIQRYWNRNIERSVLVVGTFFMTSALWFGVGLFKVKDSTVLPVALPGLAPASHTVTGDLTIDPAGGSLVSVYKHQGDSCRGNDNVESGGFDDLNAGAQITVLDSSGKMIALGSLGEGKVVKSDRDSNLCVFPFVIDKVPESDFYSVELGHRGKLTFSGKELETKGWMVHFSLSG
ncbi:MAG: hypothetical protein ACAF41_11975 [Leptolyngbya sp. BL-A-14]